MSIALLNAVFKADLPGGRKLVLVSLCDYADERGICFPSIEKLVKKCGLARRTVLQHLADLEEFGAIRRHQRRGRSTVYQLFGEAFAGAGQRRARPERAPGRSPRHSTELESWDMHGGGEAPDEDCSLASWTEYAALQNAVEYDSNLNFNEAEPTQEFDEAGDNLYRGDSQEGSAGSAPTAYIPVTPPVQNLQVTSAEPAPIITKESSPKTLATIPITPHKKHVKIGEEEDFNKNVDGNIAHRNPDGNAANFGNIDSRAEECARFADEFASEYR